MAALQKPGLKPLNPHVSICWDVSGIIPYYLGYIYTYGIIWIYIWDNMDIMISGWDSDYLNRKNLRDLYQARSAIETRSFFWPQRPPKKSRRSAARWTMWRRYWTMSSAMRMGTNPRWEGPQKIAIISLYVCIYIYVCIYGHVFFFLNPPEVDRLW